MKISYTTTADSISNKDASSSPSSSSTSSSSTPSTDSGSCNYCGKANANKFCSRCKLTSYCNRQCFKCDWKHNNHKLTCQLLQQQTKEASAANIQLLVEDLFTGEAQWLMSLSSEEQNLVMDSGYSIPYTLGRRTGTYGFRFSSNSCAGALALVLTRVSPCWAFVCDEGATFEKLYYKSVVKPWYYKHKNILRQEGLDLHWTESVVDYADGDVTKWVGLVLKDKRSPLIEKVNRVYPVAIEGRSVPVDSTNFFEDMLAADGMWIADKDCPEKCFVYYWIFNSEGFFNKILKRTIPEKCPTTLFANSATPENADELGKHFSKTRTAMKCVGIDLKLEIHTPCFWPDDAIAKTWLSAAEEDGQRLLDWLSEGTVISTYRIPTDRLCRIKKIIRKKIIKKLSSSSDV